GVLNTGFGLSAGGDEVYLYDKLSRGGGLLDSIVFGIQAADYSIGRQPNGFGTFVLNLATPGAINVPATLGPPMTLKVNEWLANPSGNDQDFFELYNPNNQPVDLGGLYLTDALANKTQYRIPNLSFVGFGLDGFVRFVADNSPGQGADHVNFRLNNDGEAIGLFTANGIQIDAVTFLSQQSGISEGRFPDGSASIARFPGTMSPGASNIRPITDIVISEVLTHTDVPLEDTIELQNISNGSIDVSGWWLSDRKNDAKKFQIPDGTVIQPGGFVVFYENQFNPVPGIYPSFALSSVKGDEVFLFTANASGDLTGFRTSVKFGAAENGVSFGRYPTSVGFDFTALSSRTFGVDSPAAVEQFRTGTGLSNAPAKIDSVLITEIMYHPPDIGTNDNFRDEFIELHNVSGSTVQLFDPQYPTNTWRLRDAVDFNFPQAVSIPANGYLLVVSFDPNTDAASLAAFRTRYSLGTSLPIYGPYGGRLDNGGENVELYRPDAPQAQGLPDAGYVPYIQTDRVKYSDGNPWPSAADGNTNGIGASLQRRMPPTPLYGNDPVNWIAGVPTPGAATGAAFSAPPSITAQPVNQTVAASGTATFTVSASGATPLTYQWRFNGVNISGATGPSLTINNAQLAQHGQYSVLVVNSAGSVLSASATLTVQSAPVITQQPQNRNVAAGATAIFTVAAQGTPPLSYQWRLNGAPVSGGTSPTLVVPSVQPANEGDYTVRVANGFGAVTSVVANLTISAVPVIVTQPQSSNVFVGATVTLSVTVNGSPPLRFQWRKNNVNIPGATNATLTFNNVQTTDTGSYTVFVTNSVGQALSSPATLNVTIPPVITIVAADATASEPGANTGRFVISRTGNTSRGLFVEFLVSGSAVPDSDYIAITSPVLIPVGSPSVSLTVTPINESVREGNETVILTVTNTAEYVLGAQTRATVTIFDDDNIAPSVTITNPISGARFNVATNILLGASASDADGSVAKVEFFDNLTNKIGEVTAPPFTLAWSNAPSGAHTLTAIATDDLGSTGVSAPVSIDINRLPIVTITSPTNGATFFAPANISIAAT
ncbi:MAG TPA: lamin tail domain-containing protein, partial [Candidatus Binatia bacterium]|nr:lamin tail domain-containing protein [Candidatus Binatia bacterium]